jgi:hypothetical protein
MNNIAKLPKPDRFVPTGTALTYAMMTASAWTRAVHSRVLVPARDIPLAQRREIMRELACARIELDTYYTLTGVPRLPGTLHLWRDRDLERIDDIMDAEPMRRDCRVVPDGELPDFTPKGAA